MNSLDISILIFIILESLNVFILYFKPSSKLGNGVAVFKSFEDSKKDEMTHLFISYLVNWVAGVKLIFIVLLLVILLYGNEATKIGAVIAMIISISSYFFRLAPIIKELDNKDFIEPKGYSKALNGMIIGFMLLFIAGLVLHFI